MTTENQVTVFEQQHLAVFQQLAGISRSKKQLELQEKKLKEELEKAMDEYEVKSIDNQFIKITRVAASSSTSVDLKALEEKEPELHKELLEDYPKVTNRKSYVMFKVK